MNKIIKFIILFIAITLESCLFGVGLIEKKISDNIYLIAINKYDESSIWYSIDGSSVPYLLVPETVFAVGYNDDFIIAKSHPKNIKNEIDKTKTYYHIIEIENINPSNHEQVSSLLKQQFEYKLEQLGVPKDLDFSIIIEYNK